MTRTTRAVDAARVAAGRRHRARRATRPQSSRAASASLLRQDYRGRIRRSSSSTITAATAPPRSRARGRGRASAAGAADRLVRAEPSRRAGPASCGRCTAGAGHVDTLAATARIPAASPMPTSRYAAETLDEARRARAARRPRADVADGEAALRELRRARADSGVHLLLPDAVSVCLGQPPAIARPRRPPAAACSCGARRCAAAGGIAAVRGELIDDCALGALHESAGADLARA